MTVAWVIRKDDEVKHIMLGDYSEVADWLDEHAVSGDSHIMDAGWHSAREDVVCDLRDATYTVAFVLAMGVTVEVDKTSVTVDDHSLTYPFTKDQLQDLAVKASDIWAQRKTETLTALTEGQH